MTLAFFGRRKFKFMNKCASIILIILLQVSPLQSLAQRPVEKKTPPPAKPVQKNEKSDDAAAKDQKEAEMTAQQVRALNLVEQTGKEAGKLEDQRQGARLQAIAADMLWKHQRDQARQLFQDAFQLADDYYQKSQDSNQIRVSNSAYTSRGDVRIEVIRLINKNDQELGREYTEKYIASKKKQRESSQSPSNSMDRMFGSDAQASRDLLQAAMTLLDTDIKLSVGIAQRSIALGVPPNLSGFLNNLAARDLSAADNLFIFALNRLRSEQAPMAAQLLSLSAYPFGDEEIKVSDGSSSSMWGFGKPKDFKFNPALAQRYLASGLEILSKASEPAVAQMSDGSTRIETALFAAKYLTPRVTEYQPALLDSWNNLIAKITSLTADRARRNIDQDASEDARKRSERQNPSPDQTSDNLRSLIDRAKNAGDIGEKDDLYSEAALAAQQAGNTSQALDLAGNITDLTIRMKIKSWISYEASLKASKEKKLDEARRLAFDVQESDQRAYLFLEIARAALTEKDQFRVNQILDEALQQAYKADDSPAKLRSLLGLINIYLQVDKNQAFVIAENFVRTANRIPVDKFLPGKDSANLTRVMESKGRSMAMVNSVDDFNSDLVFAALAKSDFQRALTLAEGFENAPVRLSSYLAIAGTALKQ